MSDTILKAENISKQYRLGLVGSGTLRDDFKRLMARVRGQEDPFLKVGAVNDRSTKSNSDYVWALRNIDFEVKRGEVLGIIGKNGAGKSTLLKILSRVTAPTTGTIKSKGRIASLLEVGTGFNPELTGRENIYLNGAILGMTRAEITSKLEEIIDFSGCERYIDTPTKRYSSGMTVRLAFAVAAHLEPEILVVDEVLAVGDAEFQKKAIGKMQDISQGEGRTVLFVSHNMASVQNLCTQGLLLENGSKVFEGKTREAIEFYLTQEKSSLTKSYYLNKKKKCFIERVEVTSNAKSEFHFSGEKLIFKLKINMYEYRNLNIDIGIYNSYDDKLINLSSEYQNINHFDSSKEEYQCILNKNPLTEGSYYINVLIKSGSEKVEHLSKCLLFNVVSGDFFKTNGLVQEVPAKFLVDHRWE